MRTYDIDSKVFCTYNGVRTLKSKGMALSATERNAFVKASRIRGWELVERVQYGVYRVHSASRDVVHTVRGTERLGGDSVCTCEAAVAGRYCWHKAAVVLARTRHEYQNARQGARATPSILTPAKTATSPRRVALV